MSDQSHNKNSLPQTVLKRIGSERLSTILWNLLPPLLTFALVAVVWEWAVHIFETPAYILPAPSRIWDSLLKDQGSILGHSGITLFEAVSGFIIGSILGALLGTFFAYSRLFAQSLLPYVIAANTIPVVAIAPIIIIWFGHGIPSKIAVTAFLSFFPLALNMMKGLRSYDHTIMDVFHVAAASKWQRFVKMRLPASLPYVFVGLKLNVTFCCHWRHYCRVRSGRPWTRVRHHDCIPHTQHATALVSNAGLRGDRNSLFRTCCTG